MRTRQSTHENPGWIITDLFTNIFSFSDLDKSLKHLSRSLGVQACLRHCSTTK